MKSGYGGYEQKLRVDMENSDLVDMAKAPGGYEKEGAVDMAKVHKRWIWWIWWIWTKSRDDTFPSGNFAVQNVP